MKASIIATAALVGVATAAPAWDSWGKHGKDVPQVFDFTSTYNVVATPGEVVGSDGKPAPGQPGAVGYFNYGINSYLDTICYVSLDTLCNLQPLY
jgi:hypothetical protein